MPLTSKPASGDAPLAPPATQPIPSHQPFRPTLRACKLLRRRGRGRGQDASRLVDICRQSIVFDTAAGMTACLRAIAADREAALLRVKNRLARGYDARLSAGYRDVALNLVLSTREARELGVENHVCELQLVLRPFADLKVRERHLRSQRRLRLLQRARARDGRARVAWAVHPPGCAPNTGDLTTGKSPARCSSRVPRRGPHRTPDVRRTRALYPRPGLISLGPRARSGSVPGAELLFFAMKLTGISPPSPPFTHIPLPGGPDPLSAAAAAAIVVGPPQSDEGHRRYVAFRQLRGE
jgi:hypothetical protein